MQGCPSCPEKAYRAQNHTKKCTIQQVEDKIPFYDFHLIIMEDINDFGL
jgi:hypothetical protein